MQECWHLYTEEAVADPSVVKHAVGAADGERCGWCCGHAPPWPRLCGVSSLPGACCWPSPRPAAELPVVTLWSLPSRVNLLSREVPFKRLEAAKLRLLPGPWPLPGWLSGQTWASCCREGNR